MSVYGPQKAHGENPETIPGDRAELEKILSEFQKEEFATAAKRNLFYGLKEKANVDRSEAESGE